MRKDETIKMLWSIVSNAAERSTRQRHDIFESLDIDEVVVDIQNSRLSRVVLTVAYAD